MHPFFAALSFLTKIPIPRQNKITGDNLVKSSAYFPLVGTVLGGLLYLLLQLLSIIFSGNAPLIAALLLVWWIFLTGALHLDGLADTFDGLVGGRTKEDRLQIMKDSATGSFGLIAVVSVLLLKYTFLQSLQNEHLLAALFYSPLLSRWSMVVLMYFTPYAKKTDSLGKPFVEQIQRKQLLSATMLTIAAGLFFPFIFFLILLPSIILLTALFRHFFIKKIGGITGDCLGAANELLELAVLFLLLLPLP